MERVGKPEGNDGWAVVEALTQSLVHEQLREDGVGFKSTTLHRYIDVKRKLTANKVIVYLYSLTYLS